MKCDQNATVISFKLSLTKQNFPTFYKLNKFSNQYQQQSPFSQNILSIYFIFTEHKPIGEFQNHRVIQIPAVSAIIQQLSAVLHASMNHVLNRPFTAHYWPSPVFPKPSTHCFSVCAVINIFESEGLCDHDRKAQIILFKGTMK